MSNHWRLSLFTFAIFIWDLANSFICQTNYAKRLGCFNRNQYINGQKRENVKIHKNGKKNVKKYKKKFVERRRKKNVKKIQKKFEPTPFTVWDT